MFYFMIAGILLAACAAFADLRTGHIPNRLTFTGVAVAMVAHLVRGAVTDGLRGAVTEGALALAGAAVTAAVPLLMFVKGGIGGGDVKLFAALGALLEPLAGLEAETYAFVFAALVVPVKLAWDGVLLRTLANTGAILLNPFRPWANKRPVPVEMRAWFRLGPSILVGTVATLIVHARVR